MWSDEDTGCYKREYDIKTARVVPDEIAEQRCNLCEEHQKRGITGLWLIDAKTGQMKMLELKADAYPWAVNTKSFLEVEWLKEFRSKLVWEKEGTGYKLVFPK